MTPSVFTIAPGIRFLDALAAGLHARFGDGPEALVDVVILLPNRRAGRSLREAFLRRTDGRPLLLPRIRPLGDVDEDELAFEDEPAALDLPPAIPTARRLTLLTRLVLARRDRRTTPDQAVRLARELARLLDQVHTERLSLDRLHDLVPAEFARHWQITLDFLDILGTAWPEILAAEGCIDAADRRNRLLAAQAAAWRTSPPAGPVVAAGSTGSIPATADLLAVVATLPDGCVVLPGLARDLDPAVRGALGPTHPQFGMSRLLARLDLDPATVADWPAPGFAAPASSRTVLAGRALLPAAATHTWRTAEPLAPDALDGVTRIDSPTARDEAGAIALTLREALETPGRTAALVTPDRGLARRVATELARWGIGVDDSAGQPLARTPPMVFLRLIARAAAEGLAPVPLLAVLKHPLAAGGHEPAVFRRWARVLDRTILRGPRPAGLDGGPTELLAAIGSALEPLRRLLVAETVTLSDALDAHVRAAETLAATADTEGAARLWGGEAGEAAADRIADLIAAADVLDAIAGTDYPALFEAMTDDAVIRPRFGRHARLHVWGLLEARLQQADVVVLGGLNEGTWPPEARANPWMSRPMMQDFGLPLPERRIGLTAHDFVQAFCAPSVVLTRATRVDGTPTVPSRWLQRIDALIQDTALAERFLPDTRPLRWFEALDTPTGKWPNPVLPPRPTPPVAARPTRLSVTQIETWIRDPYAIFARHILGLNPLDALDADPGAAGRGTIIHEALDRFVREGGDDLHRLLAIGNEEFHKANIAPGVRAFWWPRFERIAEWFLDFDRTRRTAGIIPAATEVRGGLDIGTFNLIARADRIDRFADGGFSVVDYKTGQPPSAKQVRSGLTPQLALEAAILRAGGFETVKPAEVVELLYLKLTGGRIPGEVRVIAEDVATIADAALAGLKKRVAAFQNEATPYLSRPRPMFLGRFADYDHLARVHEWSAAEGDDG